ncbi:MAG: biotin/lipoate A/B protein ligase family protein, partial [Bacillota bacterium]
MRWRLIRDGYHDGATNMAVDEAIMLAHARGEVPPTLRFYGWRPPALSLGYAQKAEREVDLEACRRAGVDVVRRPTGGRAVLHDREVTYSVVISTALFPGSVVETYRRLSAGLVEGLRLLGLQAEVQEGPPRAGLRSA